MPITLNGTTGISTPNLDSAGTVTTSNLVNGSALSFRNKIINGNFDIWQRGTSLASGTGLRYLADRFVNNSLGSTYTVSRETFELGQTIVPNNPTYFHRTVVTSVAGNLNNSVLVQRIESVKTLANKTVTISFYAKANSNKSISVSLSQWFGTGGSPSSQTEGIGSQKLNLTASWQKFTVTANIPSIQNKTLGTDNNDFLQLNFWFDAGSDWNAVTNNLGQQSGTFDIAQVQLEEGSVATPFEERPIGTELALCQRYYETGRVFVGFAIEPDGSSGTLSQSIHFNTSKRTTSPTLSSSFIPSTGDYSTTLFGSWFSLHAGGASFLISNISGSDCGGTVNWTSTAEL